MTLFGAPIYVRHEVVHNKYVVDRLRTIGAVFVDELARSAGRCHRDIQRAWRAARRCKQEAQRRSLNVFDATCPLVTKVHMEITRYAREAREVFLIGHAGHPEVEGTIGQFDASLGGSIYLVQTVEDVEALTVRNPGACGVRHADHPVRRRHGVHRRGPASPIPRAQGAGEGGHLLRNAKSPGRRQGLDRPLRGTGGGRFEIQLEFQPAARNGGQERQARIPGRRTGRSQARMVRGDQDRGRDGRRLGAGDSGAGCHCAIARNGAAKSRRNWRAARNT